MNTEPLRGRDRRVGSGDRADTCDVFNAQAIIHPPEITPAQCLSANAKRARVFHSQWAITLVHRPPTRPWLFVTLFYSDTESMLRGAPFMPHSP
ncbi:hypothetical protein GCM10028792_40320 [Salinisphaera aquimarina]